jgi:hypothetical protein
MRGASMRFGRLALALAFAGCAAPQPAVVVSELAPPAAPEHASAPPPRDACEALATPLAHLRELAALVGLGRSMPLEPVSTYRLAAALDADAKIARDMQSSDAELAKLARDTEARLTTIAAATRAFGAKLGPGREAARVTLLEEMERGELLFQIGARRCPNGGALAGTMRASAIQRVVSAGSGEIKRCYEAGLARDPGLRGAVRVRFTVAPDGKVRDAMDADVNALDPLAWTVGERTAPIGDMAVRDCVVAAFRKLVFPPPTGGAFSITYPIELTTRR